MFHDQQDASTSGLLGPLNIGFATLEQPQARPSMSPGSRTIEEDAHRHRDDEQGTFRVSVPGGASILMKDSAGTSMSLNLGIDPSSGTPILSGRAIDAHGGVLDVHPCSCNDPISLRHKLPGSPEHFRGGAHLRDHHSHLDPSPKSPFGPHRRLVHAPTPLIVVQTLMTPSPSHPELQGSEFEAQVPETSGDPLRSPFTPTPASVRHRSSNSPDSYHTPPVSPEDTPNTPLPPASSPHPPLSSRKVAFKLDATSEQSLFDPDTPLVQSPTSDGAFSDISGPSALGSLPSLPNTPSDASERSTRTVTPQSRLVHNIQLDLEERLNSEPDANGPPLDGHAFSQGSRAFSAAGSAYLGPSEGPIHPINVDTLDGPTNLADAHATDHQGTAVHSDSDHDRAIVDPLPSMPVARIGLDGPELQYNLEAQPCFNPAQEPTNPAVIRSGNLEGTWVASLHQDRMALTLDLSLDGLGLHNLSVSVPPQLPLSLDQVSAPVARQESVQLWEQPVAAEWADLWEAASDSSQSVVTFGSCPSTAPPLSDLPLTPIPELLNTPTSRDMPIPGSGAPEFPSPRASAFLSERRHPQAKIPGPLDSGPILEQLASGEGHVSTIRIALHSITRKWQNMEVMPDGVGLHVINDACSMLSYALADLFPVIKLTWPLARHASLGTDGGQPPTAEFQQRLQHMGDPERKWYLKQHEFSHSLQRNLTRLALLAQRVREDPAAAYSCNVYERVSQFAAKFQDITLRLKLAHHIQIEQKYRVRVRHSARRVVASPEQVATHEHHKARLLQVREEIEGIKRTLLTLCDPRPHRL